MVFIVNTKIEWYILAHATRGHLSTTRRPQKLSRWNIHPAQSNLVNENEAMNNGIGSPRLLAKEGKHDRRKPASSSMLSADVVHLSLLSTGILFDFTYNLHNIS